MQSLKEMSILGVALVCSAGSGGLFHQKLIALLLFRFGFFSFLLNCLSASSVFQSQSYFAVASGGNVQAGEPEAFIFSSSIKNRLILTYFDAVPVYTKKHTLCICLNAIYEGRSIIFLIFVTTFTACRSDCS